MVWFLLLDLLSWIQILSKGQMSNAIHCYFHQIGHQLLCYSAAVNSASFTRTRSSSTSRVGSEHDLILLGSCEIILAPLSSTCGLIFSIHASFYHFNPLFPTIHRISSNGWMGEISLEINATQLFWRSLLGAFWNLAFFSFLYSFLSTIFIASFMTVPSSPDANY